MGGLVEMPGGGGGGQGVGRGFTVTKANFSFFFYVLCSAGLCSASALLCSAL